MYNESNATLNYAVERSRELMNSNSKAKQFSKHLKIDILIKKDFIDNPQNKFVLSELDKLQGEGYKIKVERNNITIFSTEATGAMYGLLDLTEKIIQGEHLDQEISFKPNLEYRIIKFNLPWSPYRNSEASTLHLETCRDLKFWESYLDMMVENRFNVLSLWNIHPFPFMIKSKNYPMANDFTPMEMQQWKDFWKELFHMAKVRGIQTFIVNWNIAVSPEFAKAYEAQEYNDLSEQIKIYTKESVTQVINEYPDLTGIGVTLADWMGTFDNKMNPQQREDWIEETFVAGIKNAIREVKFLHRSVLAGDPMAMRKLINKANLEAKTLVEIKFNWSHGHSTPKLAITHDYHSGELDNRFWTPKPENYAIQWMVRNEDFFILNWGQTDFIKEHIRENAHEYVNGYFIGSEGYIPAKDYFTIDSEKANWTYAFQKQWLFYKTWGRLLYDQNTPNSYFKLAFETKYPKKGKSLFQIYQLVGKVPLCIAAFYRSTWDYTLYSEGFLAPEPSSPTSLFDRNSPFISIEELINHETLDPELQSISEFVANPDSKKKSPLKLADEIEKECKSAITILNKINYLNTSEITFKYEIEDAYTWAYLGLYFADKLRAGVFLQDFSISGNEKNKKAAVDYLEKCLIHWQSIIKYTDRRYKSVPHVALGKYKEFNAQFAWTNYLTDVENDIKIAKTAKLKN